MPKCDICNKNKNNSYVYYPCGHTNCFSCIEYLTIVKNCKNCKNCKKCNSSCDDFLKKTEIKKDYNVDFINSSQYLSLINKETRNYNLLL